jgi:hypothetical protein
MHGALGHRSWGAAAGQSRQVVNRQALQHCACIMKRSVSFLVARQGGVGCQAHATLHKAYAWRAWTASHAPLVLCLRYSCDATKHSCMPMRAVACRWSRLGLHRLALPVNFPRSHTAAHSAYRLYIDAHSSSSRRGMHACVVHSCALYMVRHAFNCWPLSNPRQAKGWCDDGRVSTCKGEISRHHNTLQWQHTCCRLPARSVSRMRPFSKHHVSNATP